MTLEYAQNYFATYQMKLLMVYFVLCKEDVWKFLTVMNSRYFSFLDWERYFYESCDISNEVNTLVLPITKQPDSNFLPNVNRRSVYLPITKPHVWKYINVLSPKRYPQMLDRNSNTCGYNFMFTSVQSVNGSPVYNLSNVTLMYNQIHVP